MNPTLREVADRMWSAAWELDERRGDFAASGWVAGKVHALMRADRADDPEEIEKLAEALERRLAEKPEEAAAVS